ncbi:HPr family phosphocarrier protein [Streptomyces sp. NPDC047117]|uniref:HPr family phosphocarrier protein n=1 Tax=Streptomyces sp. NPDC047117 TaxID=3155379 RepID=UPI0033C30E00
MPTLERRLVVTEDAGLHARPAVAFAQAAGRAAAEVTVARADAGAAARPVPARSVLSLLGLNIRRGDEIVLRASGAEAERALDALAALAAPT